MNTLSFIYYFRFFIIAAAIITVTANNSRTVAAAGFGVSPSTLDFTVEEGSESSRQFIIYNTGKESKFSAESSSLEVVQVFPSSGTLPEEGTAVATVTAFGKEVGKSTSEILISFITDGRNADNEVRFSLGTRVGISLSVVEGTAHSANPLVGMLTSSAIVGAGLFSYLALRRKNAWRLPAKA